MTDSKNSSAQEESSIQENIEALLHNCGSIQLATINAEQEAEISYTPFIISDEKLYVFISQLAPHTQNIRDIPKLSVLLIEDETKTKNIFARKRLALKCEAKEIDRQENIWQSRLQEFEQKHGQTVSLLKTLPDFALFELNILSGTYIQGFGQAFRIDSMKLNNLQLITGV